MESDNGISSIYLVNRYQALTSAGIGNHAVRPQNGRLFPLTANSDHAWVVLLYTRQDQNIRLASVFLTFCSKCELFV